MPPSKSTVDFATREAIRSESKKLATRERGRQSRSVVRARSKAKIAEAQERSRLQIEAAQRREDIKAAGAQQRAALKAQAKATPTQSRARQVAGGTASAIGGGVSSASQTSVGQIVILVLMVMGGLIVFFNLVTRPQATNTKFGQLGGWLATLSTDKPLFVKNTGTRPAGTTGSTSNSGGNVA